MSLIRIHNDFTCSEVSETFSLMSEVNSSVRSSDLTPYDFFFYDITNRRFMPTYQI